MLVYTKFRYCPKCGSPVVEQFEKNAMKCEQCDYAYYHNTAAAVAAIIEVDKKLLFIRRTKNPQKGFLDLPGGFIDYGETLEDGIQREIKEELNLDLDNLTYYSSAPNTYFYRGVTYFTSDAFFKCTARSLDTLKKNNEVEEVLILAPEEIKMDQIAFESSKIMLRKMYSHLV